MTFEGIRLTLDKKSKWEINGYDKRPCQGEGEIHTKISGIYADYVRMSPSMIFRSRRKKEYCLFTRRT